MSEPAYVESIRAAHRQLDETIFAPDGDLTIGQVADAVYLADRVLSRWRAFIPVGDTEALDARDRASWATAAALGELSRLIGERRAA